MTIPMRRGVHLPLEEAANSLLKESMKGITRHADKSDILTPWKEQERRRREVYVPSGTPDAAVRSGIFYRSVNATHPYLNSRGGIVRGRRIITPSEAGPSPADGFKPRDGSGWDLE